jgi:hypothetical protein
VRGDIEKAISRYDKNWEIVHTDTVKHADCLTERLELLPDWETFSMPIAEERDGVFYSRIPDLVPHEEIRKEYESAKVGCTLDVFYRENLCKPGADEAAVFKREYFKHWDSLNVQLNRSFQEMDSIVLIDPARTPNPQSAESAVIGLTVDRSRPAIYIRDVLSARIPPDRMIDAAIDMADAIKAHIVGIEKTGLGEYAIFPFETRMRQRGKTFNIIPLNARAGVGESGKIARGKALIPMYRRGEIYHKKGVCERLEQQLLSFPQPRQWDMIDALSYVVTVLSEGDQFWLPPASTGDYAAAAKEWEEIQARDRREYAPIEWGVC